MNGQGGILFYRFLNSFQMLSARDTMPLAEAEIRLFFFFQDCVTCTIPTQ